ncbi:hypothetical protein [Candidatus Methylacidithermus pantelleriae]|nr:hypothetical protein [Candidatus Methylacidithermus pantelleriae]
MGVQTPNLFRCARQTCLTSEYWDLTHEWLRRLLGTVLRGSLPVNPGAHQNNDLMQAAHDTIGPLMRIHHQDESTLRGQSRFPLLETETHQPVAVLNQNDANLRITQQANEPSAMAVHLRADLLDGLDDPQRFP